MEFKLLSTSQAAMLLGGSEASIKRSCDLGLIPSVRVLRARRFALADLIAVLRQRDRAPALPATGEAFAAALASGRLDACTARIADLCLGGTPLARCLV